MDRLFYLPLVLLTVFSCRNSSAPVQTFQRPVKTYTVESLEYVNRSFSGNVSSDQTVNLGFKIGGQLIKLNVEEGDIVKKGQFIAEIDPVDYQLKLDAAKATYISSKSQRDRFERLVERNAISKQEYESAQANYARDKAAYENAVNVMGDTKLYAPFGGVVQKRFVENFERVQPSEPVIFLSNPALLNINFTLPESSINLVKLPNKRFFVTFDNYPNVSFGAKVYKFVDVSTDGAGMPITLTIDDPAFIMDKYDIRPGFTCTVRIRVENPGYKDVTAVPITAIYSEISDGAKYAWIVKDGAVYKQSVKVGQLFGSDMIIVEQGLKPSEIIVSAGGYQLIEGQKIKILTE